MLPGLKFVTIVIVGVVFLFPGIQNRRIQQFSLYSISDQIENYTQNVGELDLVSGIVSQNKLQSVCSQLGVWAFFTGKNYTTVYSYGYHPASPEWTCNNRRIMADWQSPFQSIRHLANSDLDVPSLSLYNLPFFASDELYLNGKEFSISQSSPIQFGSFGFTGRESWTLYSEPNFQGESVCLQCKCDDVGLKVGVTYTAKLSLSALSIRQGCFGSQVLLPSGILQTRTPPTDTHNNNNKNLIKLTLNNSKDNSSLSFTGTEIKLPCCKTYDSFQMTYTSSWSVFSGTNFDGVQSCLRYGTNTRSSRKNSNNVESESTEMPLIIIGSIRVGCPQNAEKKNITILTAKEKSNDSINNNTNPNNGSAASNSGSGITTTTRRPNRNNGGRGTQPSRQGYERLIPGDLEGFSPKTTKRTTTTTTTTPEPVVEEIVSPSSINDNNLEPSSNTQGGVQVSTESVKNDEGDEGNPITTSKSQIYTVEPEIPKPGPTNNELDTEIPRPPSKEASIFEDEDGDPDSGASGMFFTAFLIILGILIVAMIVTIGVFIYLRATRSSELDVES